MKHFLVKIKILGIDECSYTGYSCNGRLAKIEKFQCMVEYDNNDFNHYEFGDMKNSVTKFCDNFNKYYSNNCENKWKNIRNIKQLVIGQYRNSYDELATDRNMRKRVLLTLVPICEKIKIENCGLNIENENQDLKIFHPNLKIFEINNRSAINFADTINIVNINGNINGKNKVSNYKCECEFELSIIVEDY